MMATERTPPKNAPEQMQTVSASRPTGTCLIVLLLSTMRISELTQSSGRLAASVTPAFTSWSWMRWLTSIYSIRFH
jgi:hypothetical protein